MSRPRCKYRQFAPIPPDRMPPFLLTPDGADLVLIAPFPKRPHGLTPSEAALVQAVAGHLRKVPVPGRGSVWIDPRDGTTTPAAIGEPQIRRRLIDNASFNVRAERSCTRS